MRGKAKGFVGDVPTYYEAGLGRHLLIGFAADLARRVVTGKAPRCVLDLAAGTGIATRILRNVLPSSTRLVASDLSSCMLAAARQKFTRDEQIEFEQADATALPFRDATFDAVVCQFGVMFFSDPDRSYREAHRVLAPGGCYHFNVWASFEFNPLARITRDTVARLLQGDSPAFYEVPFRYHDVGAIGTSLRSAGFERVSCDVLRMESIISDVWILAQGLVLGTPAFEELLAQGVANPEPLIAALAEAIEHAFGPNPCRIPLQAIVMDASKP